MLQNIVGIILILLPFTAVFFYYSISEGFLKVFLFVSLFHFTLSIVTQLFHIFNYPLILCSHVIFVVILVSALYLKKKGIPFLARDLFFVARKNWIFFIALVIIFFQLFSVHYSYTGIVQTLRGQQTVYNSTYVYPFVSDEWTTISEIKYSIENHALPVVNPLDHNIPIPNILFAFPAVLAGVFLLLGLNPLTQYWLVSIFFGLVVCISVFVFLKTYRVNTTIATSSMLCIPYVVNGGNMLALWSFLPFTFGMIFLLWQLIAQKKGYIIYTSIFAFLALLVYPPTVVFVIPVLLVWLYNRQKDKDELKKIKEKIWQYLIPIGIGIFVFVTIFYLALAFFDITIVGVLEKYIVRSNLDVGIVSFVPWHVIPAIVVIFALFGVYRIIKSKYYDLITVISVGFLYWCIYTFVNKVFIIEYQRIIFFTSVFLIIIAGIGGEWLVSILMNKVAYKKINHNVVMSILGILVILISIFLLPSYSSRISWQKLPLIIKDETGNRKKIISAAPINRYLVPDDLRLFQTIHGVNFIAPPWKGLVIGVATDNFPFETKSATIGNGIFSYNIFMHLNCEYKNQLAKQYYLSYVYSDRFICPNFELMGTSSENLYLYKYTNGVNF